MKRLWFFLFALSVHAATYYVASSTSSPAGSNANPGTSGAPWLTVAFAVTQMACGDTLNVVADGKTVVGDATLPYFASCALTTTIQSSKLGLFWPVAWRTNPFTANCAAVGPCGDLGNYGKLTLAASGGIVAAGEVHGFSGGFIYQNVSVSGSTFTLTAGNSYAANGVTFANGSQVDFEINNEDNGDAIPPATVAVPSPLTTLTKYYVVNCSVSPACGNQNSTFQVSATSGGAPITITACDASCGVYTDVGIGLQVNTATSTFTAIDSSISTWANNTPVTFARGTLQLGGSLPGSLAQDTIYYVKNLSGNSFQLSASAGPGALLSISNVGTGITTASNSNVPHDWAFRGLEISPVSSGALVFNEIQFGGGSETSTLSMVHNMEVDRCYVHDFSETSEGPIRGILDNGQSIYIHDSWIAGLKSSFTDAQAVGGWSSLGPTTLNNNLLEASGENTLYGGSWPSYYPLKNQSKTFSGNLFYKPFIWKYGSGTAVPMGTCLYDSGTIDPNHSGGEFYLDTMSSQGYTCSAGSWGTSSTVTHWGVKNLTESKSGSTFTYNGNILQGSWTDQQNGQAFTFGQAEGSGPGIANDHFVVTNNLVQNVYQFLTSGTRCTGVSTGVLPCLNGLPNVHTYTNNLEISGGIGYCGISTTVTCGFALGNAEANNPNPVVNSQTAEFWNHNTLFIPDGISGAPYFPSAFFYDMGGGLGGNYNQATFENTLASYGLSGCGPYQFAFQNCFLNSTWTHMVVANSAGQTYTTPGATNTMNNTSQPAANTNIGFTNISTGNFALTSMSAYSASNGSATLLATDGTDMGADIAVVNMNTSGALAGTPTWDVRAGLTTQLSSTKVVFRYNAPTSAACTVTVYNSIIRISGNVVATVADSAGTSVSDATRREILVTGLSANTTYTYSLSCAGGAVVMIGTVTTAATQSGATIAYLKFGQAVVVKYCTDAALTMGCVTLGSAATQNIPLAADTVVYWGATGGGPASILVSAGLASGSIPGRVIGGAVTVGGVVK